MEHRLLKYPPSPVWETELTTLLFLKFVLKPFMAPPLFIADTSQLPPADEAAADTGDATSLRVTSCERKYPPVGPSSYRDPAKANISPYISNKYVRPSRDLPGPEPPQTPHAGARSPRVFAALIDPQAFDRGGIFVFPYRRPDDLICEVADKVDEHLELARDPEVRGYAHPVTWAAGRMTRIALPNPRLRVVLTWLAAQGIDVVRIYGTLRLSGEAFIDALNFYRRLETQQQELEAALRKEKQSLRSFAAFSRQRLTRETCYLVAAEVSEIMASIDTVRHPRVDAIAHYRRQLGIYKHGTQLGKHAFWTPLVKCGVNALRAGRRLNEITACAAIATFLNETWPMRPRWTRERVKARYYHSL